MCGHVVVEAAAHRVDALQPLQPCSDLLARRLEGAGAAAVAAVAGEGEPGDEQAGGGEHGPLAGGEAGQGRVREKGVERGRRRWE